MDQGSVFVVNFLVKNSSSYVSKVTKVKKLSKVYTDWVSVIVADNFVVNR